MGITPMEYIWFNGRLVPWAEATIHVLSHVVHYGTSFFGGIRCYETPRGPAIFRLTPHIRRLADSAKIYRTDTAELQRRFFALVQGEAPDEHGWLEYAAA